MKKMMMTLSAAMLVLSGAAGCGNANDKGTSGNEAANAAGTEEFTLRIAMGSPGEKLIAVWNELKDQYEAAHPNITVDLNFQDDDMYQTIGLPNLLNSDNAPDIYFEWAGQRLKMRNDEGYAADLTEAVQQDGLKDRFVPSDYNGMTIDDKVYMIPSNADVTNIIWYNKDIFSSLKLTPPKTWDEFIEVSKKIQAADITPIAVGNKDLWAGGNWMAHIISRVVGEQAYADAMTLNKPFNSPEFVKALNYIKELRDGELVNKSANAIADNEADTLFMNGQAAMHPIGSWFVSTALEEAPDFDYDFFNLPSMPGGAGDQSSVLGVATGYMINKKTEHLQAAIDFMKLYVSPEASAKLLENGVTPMAKGSVDPSKTDALTVKLNDLLKNATSLVSPPDTGYNLEIADALNSATSQVLGGDNTPEAALAEVDKKIAHLKTDKK
ncbi:ABC transporter substrate-binding protein [Paenibacillus sp. BC26]|uniref:ABC transporter substrate-binding protein n=1 Tax=Paenibacillus sp. BC26 TaxID=1881032 RepID=UPI0008E403F3|nr:sugar ABC transporter substrate-binding protein [Paenibacillus sp. BC26]SFT20642.1 carbohydrate ABC transporter substrate-binding protein, CUT1 family [Paenibacillus sp. BC26]